MNKEILSKRNNKRFLQKIPRLEEISRARKDTRNPHNVLQMSDAVFHRIFWRFSPLHQVWNNDMQQQDNRWPFPKKGINIIFCLFYRIPRYPREMEWDLGRIESSGGQRAHFGRPQKGPSANFEQHRQKEEKAQSRRPGFWGELFSIVIFLLLLKLS